MIKEALHSLEEGVKVEGVLTKAVKFADDQAMVAGQRKDYRVSWKKRTEWLRAMKGK